MRFGVQAGWLSSGIHVGRLNKNGNAFVQKEEATDMVLAAVAQYVMRNFGDSEGGGGMAATFPRLGLNLEVKVTPMVSGNEETPCSECGQVGGPYPNGDRPSGNGAPMRSGCERCGWCY